MAPGAGIQGTAPAWVTEPATARPVKAWVVGAWVCVFGLSVCHGHRPSWWPQMHSATSSNHSLSSRQKVCRRMLVC